MRKTIILTGATDGIGLETARRLASDGHHLLLHGRSPDKLQRIVGQLSELPSGAQIESYVADLSKPADVEAMLEAVTARHDKLDVLINNAGILGASEPVTEQGLDVRFVVNTIAPYRLTQGLLPLLGKEGRVINLSSAAQAPVDLQALAGKTRLPDRAAYAQSKLAITMWSRHLALLLEKTGPAVIAVNPGSLLGSKMVKEAYGMEGGDIGIGADILCGAALSDEFADATGLYFDNDSGEFAAPHADALNAKKTEQVVQAIETLL